MSQETNSIVTLCNSSYDAGKKEGAIEVLEKVKAEISELLGSSVWQYDVRKIIDKHIAELKGGDSLSLK